MEKLVQLINFVNISMITEKREKYEIQLDKPSKVDSVAREIAQEFLKDKDREYFLVFALNTKNRINNVSVASVGTANSALVHPREVFKTLVLSNASSFIVVHNHPSGDVTPSNEDKSITSRLRQCGHLMGIEIMDHIIIGQDKYCSFKEEGYL